MIIELKIAIFVAVGVVLAVLTRRSLTSFREHGVFRLFSWMTFTALVLAGRMSAKLASELGTMKVTEQLDAMTCLSLDVFFYLFSPRVIAGFVMTTVLFIFASTVTIVCAQILATIAFGLSPYIFYSSMKLLFSVLDVVIMLVKGFVFGGILSLVGCYYGSPPQP